MSSAENSCSVPSSSPSPFAVPSNIPVPPSPLAAPETTSFATPTPVIPLRAPPRAFVSPIPPTYGQPHTPLRHVHSGPCTYTPTEPRAHEITDNMNDEPTESRKRDHAEPDNVGETVS